MRRRELLKTVGASLATAMLPLSRVHADAAYDFYFTRLSYESGDWNVDERAPSNIINALI